MIARLLVPAALALALVSYLTLEGRGIDDELHLIAPDAARAGDPIPIRAHWFAGIDRPEGPTLVAAQVRVTLLAPDGAKVNALQLTPSYGNSLAGVLVPQRWPQGRATLRATATHDGKRLEVERPLRFDDNAGAIPEDTTASEVGTVLADLRVRGGACTPELPCGLLLRANADTRALRLESNASVSAPKATRAVPPSRIVQATVVTHGPRAHVDVIATHADGSETRQALPLPLALGSARIAPIGPVLPAPASPTITRLDERGGCIVDAFVDGRWMRTGALEACARGDAIPFAPLTAGLWHLQARSDLFASDSAALRALYVRDPAQTDAQVLDALAQTVLRVRPSDAFAREVRARAATYVSERDAVAAYLLAALEGHVHAQPTPVSSLPAARKALARERARARTFALLTLALAGLTLALLVAQRGLDAGARTRRSLHEAGAQSVPPAARQRLRVLAVATSLLLIFAAIAVYLIVRSHAR